MLTPEWLTTQLQKAGVLDRGTVLSIDSGDRHSYTASMQRLSLQYSPDAPSTAPSRLIIKQNIRQPELDFHQQIAPRTKGDYLLRCYAAGIEGNTRYLLMDDLTDTHEEPIDTLPQPISTCEKLVDILADFHTQWWGYTEPTEDVIGFVQQQAANGFAQFVDTLGDRLSEQRRGWLERVLAAPPRHMDRLTRNEQITLVHGDPHYWNFLYPRTPDGQIYLLDWAVWHRNLPTSDICYQITQLCSPERRARIEQPLVRRYHEQLQARGISGYTWDQCWQDYRLALVEHTLWIVFWQQVAPPGIWWRALENFTGAFEDLGCEELL